MTRRHFTAAAAGLLPVAAAPTRTEPALIKPRVLRPGDTVSLITPSTYVTDPDTLEEAARTVEFFSLKPKWGANVRKRWGYLGGSVEERVADLHAAFRDPATQGVFALRGGYGAAQLLDSLDYNLIREHPKFFIGYSDITALHLGINRKAGLLTFHGPVVLSHFTEYTQAFYRKALFGTGPIGAVGNPPETNPLRPAHTLRTVRPGQARGTLIGGNLTLISTTLGTPYEIETGGRILFIEDVDEEPYRIDRMLTQLRLAGKLQAAAGIVVGECADCRPKDYKPSFNNTFTLGEILDNIFGELKIPVLAGLTIGHTDDQLTLPEGALATLDAGKKQLTIEEVAVTS